MQADRAARAARDPLSRAAHAIHTAPLGQMGRTTRGLPHNPMSNSKEPQITVKPIRPDSPTFAQLGARPETVAALAAVSITHAFAIQEYAVPIALRGSDLIGQAPTGTGKTLGFGIPLVDRVFSPAEGGDGVPQALVVVPTRELGLQVAKDL